jgi:Sec-independent protein translocase protein TatA
MPDVLIVLIAVLIVVLIWRGPKTIPDLGKALGRGVKEARKEASEIKSELGDDDTAPPATGD